MLSGVYYTGFLLFRGGADVAQQQGDLSKQNLALEYSEGTGFLLLGTEPLRRTASLDLSIGFRSRHKWKCEKVQPSVASS